MEKPVSVVESHFVVRNGRLEEHLIRTGTSGNRAFIDQLTFVFHRATISKLMGIATPATESQGVYQDYAIVLSHYLEEIFGFGISADRKTRTRGNLYLVVLAIAIR